jgi:chemotaxis protein methyltransferase CheR
MSLALAASPAVDQEFAFSSADFERVRSSSTSAPASACSRQAGHGVQPPVAPPARDRPPELSDYLQWLEAGTGAEADAEWQEFVNCLTTNLTSFFREDHHFTRWRKTCEPARRQAAAASGATRLHRRGALLDPGDDGGRDLGAPRPANHRQRHRHQGAGHRARGVYEAGSRGLSPERLKRHFLRGTGGNPGSIRVKPELARLIEFRTFNLMTRAGRWASPSTWCSAAT